MYIDTEGSPSTPRFTLGSGLWKNIPAPQLPLAIGVQTEKARRVLSENDVSLPEEARLTLIASAAAEATLLFFNAVLQEPSRAELEEFFSEFVMKCAGVAA